MVDQPESIHVLLAQRDEIRKNKRRRRRSVVAKGYPTEPPNHTLRSWHFPTDKARISNVSYGHGVLPGKVFPISSPKPQLWGKCSTHRTKTNWIFISAIYSTPVLTLFFTDFLFLFCVFADRGGLDCRIWRNKLRDRKQEVVVVVRLSFRYISSKPEKAAVLWNLCLRWKHFLPPEFRRRQRRRGNREEDCAARVRSIQEARKQEITSQRVPRPQFSAEGGVIVWVLRCVCVCLCGGKPKQVIFSTG